MGGDAGPQTLGDSEDDGVGAGEREARGLSAMDILGQEK